MGWDMGGSISLVMMCHTLQLPVYSKETVGHMYILHYFPQLSFFLLVILYYYYYRDGEDRNYKTVEGLLVLLVREVEWNGLAWLMK